MAIFTIADKYTNRRTNWADIFYKCKFTYIHTLVLTGVMHVDNSVIRGDNLATHEYLYQVLNRV